jgi:glutamine synthetase adenylyltransferase
MRFLAGSEALGDRATGTLETLFERFTADASFGQSVREMRTKLEVAESPEKSFKYSPGAIYDIDFITSFLLVKHGVADKRGSLRDRLWRCAGCGVLDKGDAGVLDHAAELFRTAEHVARLVVGRAVKWLPATEHGRRVTEKLAGQILERKFPDGLESELDRTFERVRAIYEKVMRE